MAYDSKGNRNQRLIIKGNDANPTGAGWLPLQYIPIYVTNAFVTLEDRGFYKHNGVLDSAIQNSLIANLELGRFMRGGSTITMQLAKNLWLTREKTLLRKIHEIFLTIPLEKCLTKEQILELYLNVIEFGSDVYGIERAADHYFHCQVNQLTEEQAFYLAMILPNPKKALPPDKGGLAKAQRMLKERDEYHDALASFEDEDE
jgi:membrane peptidoglycan carboxypeptidase